MDNQVPACSTVLGVYGRLNAGDLQSKAVALNCGL